MRLQPSICSCYGSLENNPQPVLFMSVSVSGTWVLGFGVLLSGFGAHKRKWINHSTNITTIKSFSCSLRADGKGKSNPAKETHGTPDQDSDWGVCSSAFLVFCCFALLPRLLHTFQGATTRWEKVSVIYIRKMYKKN